jgi:hypothetical protein
MRILAWLFFRPPESGWRWQVISGLTALSAVAFAVMYYNLFAQTVPMQGGGGGHPQIALEQALVFDFCGKYGHLSPVVDSGRFLQRDKWPTDQTFSETIVAKYGSVGRFCEEQFQRFLNGENSLSLLLSALLLLPPGDSASTLAVKMILFECVVLFLALYFLSLFGAGLLPLSFVSLAAVKSLSVQLQPAVISQYPMMSILLLFTSALLALLWPAVARGKPYVLPLAGLAVGLVLGFVYNWRTPYGLIMAVQVVVFLFIAVLKYRRQDRILLRIGAISSGAFVGFLAFQAVLIWPLEKDIRYNYSHHPIWHPIVLGLGALPSPLAEREGIKWDDGAAFKLAKEVDPNVTYLGPTYDHALRSYYFQLWKRHPLEVAGIYFKGIFETSRTMGFSLLGQLAEVVIPNGFVWFSILLSIAIGGYFLLWLSPQLAIFTIVMAVALIGVSFEQAIVMPIFTWSYQGSLVVGFETLLAVLMVFAFAGVVLRAPGQDSGTGVPGSWGCGEGRTRKWWSTDRPSKTGVTDVQRPHLARTDKSERGP